MNVRRQYKTRIPFDRIIRDAVQERLGRIYLQAYVVLLNCRTSSDDTT